MDPYNDGLCPQEIEAEVATWDWAGYPCQVIGLANLLTQGEKGDSLMHYVWPYEGQFKDGKWVFHKGKIMDGATEVDAPNKPMLVDASSARAFALVYKAVNDKNKAKLCEFVQSRGMFFWAMDKLIWPNVGFGGR